LPNIASNKGVVEGIFNDNQLFRSFGKILFLGEYRKDLHISSFIVSSDGNKIHKSLLNRLLF
jgi:hypothetical protein